MVTGGAGFLGSLLYRRLLEAGTEVVCLDNFLTGSRVYDEAKRFAEAREESREDGPALAWQAARAARAGGAR